MTKFTKNRKKRNIKNKKTTTKTEKHEFVGVTFQVVKLKYKFQKKYLNN